MPKRTKSYEDDLVERLKDPDYAVVYLNAVLEDDSDDSEGRFLQALRYIAKARDVGMSQLASDTRLGRQALYRSLSEEGNPRLSTLSRVLGQMGFQLQVSSRGGHAPR